jgi:mannose-1-phosphate guanylyltransferase
MPAADRRAPRALIPDRRAPRALLLTAGLGTRLQPLTYVRAKAAVPINGEPLVRRVIRILATAGIRDLVLNLHHRPQSIAACVGDGSDLDVRVRYSWEQPVLGSAGGPRRALPLVVDATEDDFLIVNGDTLTDVDIWSLIERHRESGALVTMALIPNPRPHQYGGVAVTDDGWVSGFTRASGAGTTNTSSAFHFIGVQVAKAKAFVDLADGVPAESVNALYPKLIAANPRSVAAYISPASFLDIGTPHDCLDTSLRLAHYEGSRFTGADSRVDPSAVLVRTMLWDDVTVGAGAHLQDCIVADAVRIPDGAKYERCAIVAAAGNSPAPGETIDGELLIRKFAEPLTGS